MYPSPVHDCVPTVTSIQALEPWLFTTSYTSYKCGSLSKIDDVVLNDGADAISDGTNAVGDTARRVETGKIQDYGALIFMGVVVLGVIYLYGFGR